MLPSTMLLPLVRLGVALSVSRVWQRCSDLCEQYARDRHFRRPQVWAHYVCAWLHALVCLGLLPLRLGPVEGFYVSDQPVTLGFQGLQAWSLGYFLWDLTLCWNGQYGRSMLLHAVLACITWGCVYVWASYGRIAYLLGLFEIPVLFRHLAMLGREALPAPTSLVPTWIRWCDYGFYVLFVGLRLGWVLLEGTLWLLALWRYGEWTTMASVLAGTLGSVAGLQIYWVLAPPPTHLTIADA